MIVTFISTGVFKKNAAKLSSEVIYKQKEVFNDERERNTFIIRTKDTKFEHILGKCRAKKCF